jgi:hypothetical protein
MTCLGQIDSQSSSCTEASRELLACLTKAAKNIQDCSPDTLTAAAALYCPEAALGVALCTNSGRR